MITKIYSDKIINKGRLFDGFLYYDGNVITKISKEEHKADRSLDFSGLYVAPGFIDFHTHGGGGHPFLHTTADDVIKGCQYHLAKGTTSIAPTISAADFSDMKCAVKCISDAISSNKFEGTILGAHLEGPYLSKNQCGAQCPTFITPPAESDYESLIKEYGKHIVRWTYAPESDTDGKFCRYLVSHGILPSAGHTDAVYDDMQKAFKNGCRLVTHLYSCTSTITRQGGFRSLGVIESAYLIDDIYCEIIADGKHLPPELIKMIIKIKGYDKVIPVTDSLSLAGTKEKQGIMGGTEYIIEDGVCKLHDRSAFAGSIATADVLLRVLTKECEIPVEIAVKMMTENPAKLLNIKKGSFKKGFDADIVVFDDNINIKKVIAMGKDV
ncbi:MAG: N-acetylglucosamine-6-phosphate deacetylase [Clostridia bacterium]|nr:N-acetylglucosamine-6-phosphate deacetylase [Clostridia bacterium]